MIIQVAITLDLYGARFSPTRFSARTGVVFDDIIEQGVTPMVSGRYKGQLSPYGSGKVRVSVSTGADYNEVLNKLLLDFYRNVQHYWSDNSLTSRTLWITISFDQDGQTGFEITPDNASLIGRLGLTMAVNINQSV